MVEHAFTSHVLGAGGATDAVTAGAPTALGGIGGTIVAGGAAGGSAVGGADATMEGAGGAPGGSTGGAGVALAAGTPRVHIWRGPTYGWNEQSEARND